MAKFTQPRFWKTLERHPLSAEYDDLSQTQAANMAAGVKEFGIVDDRKIILHEHDGKPKVLDGWQLLQACIAVEVKPEFVGLKKGMAPEAWVEIKNDIRRHEATAKAEQRIEERRKRIVEAAPVKSLRLIAEEEGISEAQVRKDLAAVEAKEAPSDTEEVSPPPPPKRRPAAVVGRDGKLHARPATEPPLCDRCERLGKATKDCNRCADLAEDFNAKQKAKKPIKSGKPKYDDKRLIEKFIGPLQRELTRRYELMGGKPRYHTCKTHLDAILQEIKAWQAEG
jgi:hypothetical protein